MPRIDTIIKILSISLMCSTLYVSAEATNALDSVYVKAGVGRMRFDSFRDKKDAAYLKRAPQHSPIYNVGIGYKVTDSLRTDLNLLYSEINYKAIVNGPLTHVDDTSTAQQRIRTIAAFVNGYYDLNFNKTIVPYFTAGAGVSRNRAGDLITTSFGFTLPPNQGRTTTNFLWNIGVGAKYNFNKNFALDLGYRYMDLGTIKVDSTKGPRARQNIIGHQVIGSLIYSF